MRYGKIDQKTINLIKTNGLKIRDVSQKASIGLTTAYRAYSQGNVTLRSKKCFEEAVRALCEVSVVKEEPKEANSLHLDWSQVA